jgi:hypothetical protein
MQVRSVADAGPGEEEGMMHGTIFKARKVPRLNIRSVKIAPPAAPKHGGASQLGEKEPHSDIGLECAPTP